MTEESDEHLSASIRELARVIIRHAGVSPEVALAFAELLERVRQEAAWAKVRASLQQMAIDNSVGMLLRRQAEAMEAIRTSSEPLVLLPDFTGDDYSELEHAVLDLLPATTEDVHEIERAAAQASVNPENQTLIARIAVHFPDRSSLQNMATWTGFVAVATYLLNVAPEMNANRIAMIAVVVAVWTVLIQRQP